MDSGNGPAAAKQMFPTVWSVRPETSCPPSPYWF